MRWTRFQIGLLVGGFVVMTVLWGGSFVAIDVGLADWPPLFFAGFRYLVAGVVILAYAVVFTQSWRPTSIPDAVGIGIAGVFIIAAYHGLLYIGELHISGAVAAIIVSLSPVLTAVIVSILYSERRITPIQAAGFLVGIGGVIAIADPSLNRLWSLELLGIGLVFFATFAFSLGGVLLKPIQHGLSMAALQSWAMVLGGALLLVGGLVRGESLTAIGWTPTAAGTFLYLTFGSGVVGFLLYFQLLELVNPTQLHLVGYLEPVVAAILGWLLLDYALAVNVVVGFGAIFLSFLLLEWRYLGRRLTHTINTTR